MAVGPQPSRRSGRRGRRDRCARRSCRPPTTDHRSLALLIAFRLLLLCHLELPTPKITSDSFCQPGTHTGVAWPLREAEAALRRRDLDIRSHRHDAVRGVRVFTEILGHTGSMGLARTWRPAAPFSSCFLAVTRSSGIGPFQLTFRLFVHTGHSQFARWIPGGDHVPSPGGRTDGGSVLGQYRRMTR